MSGQAPWQNGRRAWERLGGCYHIAAGRAQPVEVNDRAVANAMHNLEDVRLVRGLLAQAELGAVRRARQCGVSWADIATMLGVTRQSAWERWHEDTEEAVVPGL